ncbi:MAG: hypothetical protein K2R93_08775 [Gemmatimonadaceae bacterium]|nr:hypothetical protein [Gemmatimonadaceae bacterium]
MPEPRDATVLSPSLERRFASVAVSASPLSIVPGQGLLQRLSPSIERLWLDPLMLTRMDQQSLTRSSTSAGVAIVICGQMRREFAARALPIVALGRAYLLDVEDPEWELRARSLLSGPSLADRMRSRMLEDLCERLSVLSLPARLWLLQLFARPSPQRRAAPPVAVYQRIARELQQARLASAGAIVSVLRLPLACEMLVVRDWTLERLSVEAGITSPKRLRSLLVRHIGWGPRELRRRFDEGYVSERLCEALRR